MPLYYQPVRFTPGVDWLCLREISGFEEQEIEGTSASAAMRLVERMLVDAPPVAPLKAELPRQLSLPDRDRLLAGIYSQVFGNKIESALECANCHSPFDMDFALDAFLQHLDSNEATQEVEWREDGSFLLNQDVKLRVPTGEDEWAIWGLDNEAARKELIKRCVVEGEWAEDESAIEQAIQTAAPMLATEMKAQCPECGHEMDVQFDMQSYLLNALKIEKRRLWVEIHLLASTYKWSHEKILQLPRSERQRYAKIIESTI